MNRNIGGTATRVLTLALAMVTVATATYAQRPKGQSAAKGEDRISVIDGRTSGFVLGVSTIGATGLSIPTDGFGSLQTSFGPGAGVMIGYGFNRTFSAFASVDVAKQPANDQEVDGNFGLRHLEIGGRANLPFGDGATVPYVTAGLGRRALGARIISPDGMQEADLEFSGSMFALGGGVEHSFSSSLAMDGGVELGFGRFNSVEFNGMKATANVGGSNTIRLRAGVTWRPARRGK